MKLLLGAGCLFLPVVLFWVLAFGLLLVILREAASLLFAGLVGLTVGLVAIGLGGADQDIAVVVGVLTFFATYGAMLWRRWRSGGRGGERGDADAG